MDASFEMGLSSRMSSRPSSRLSSFFDDDDNGFLLPSLDSQRMSHRTANLSARPSSRSMHSVRTGKKKYAKGQRGRFPTGDHGADDGGVSGRVSIRRLRPNSQPLDSLERGMVISLIKECIERLSLIQDVGVNIEEEKKDFEVRFGEEIDKVLAHQQELEKRYSRLIEERRHALKLLSQKTLLEDHTVVTDQLKDNDKQRGEIREEIRKKRFFFLVVFWDMS
eukprot:TRINITY_DN8345_c0_g3_i1.p1 TRINITY_DN8345_c0_g3~~TRINITY_DN8345_c0_g3_i1.p1  ORF type:complete len:222 (+),score=34.54 TRINITY_DN8345_c0_g3_i1:71-736(+)